MLGHKWETVQGTIVNAETLSPGSGHGSADRPVHRYTVELQRPSNGQYVRGTVDERHEFRRSLDSPITVEVHSRTSELRLDPSDPGPTMTMINVEQQMRETAAAAGSVGGLGGASVFATGGVHVRTGSMHVIGPGGQDITADLQGEDISGLLHTIMSGDPAAKQAARERMHEIHERARQRAAGQQPEPGHSGSVSGGIPSQADPAASFGEQVGFGQVSSSSFGGGANPGSAEQRLTALKDLLDRGILTEPEYQAKRQQIIAEL